MSVSTAGTRTATEWIAILDFGSQYTQLIARRIREAHIFCEILPHDAVDRLSDPLLKGIVLSGGPASIYGDGAPPLRPEVLDRDVPVLGICYGMQLLAHALGGDVRADPGGREYGPAVMDVESEGILAGLGDRLDVWMSHGDRVETAPPGSHVIARSSGAPIAGFVLPERRIHAIQFHPEVSHTPKGRDILDRFLHQVCECHDTWQMDSFVESQLTAIREKVGDRQVLCAVSAGVDSSVAATLVGRAIGDRLHPMFVDHGLHRDLNDDREVLAALEKSAGVKVARIDAADTFLSRLQGVTDPEEKRKIIGETFIRVFEAEAKKIGDVSLLVQGTLYPDVIESSVGHHSAARIKTHHNVGGLPERMDLDLLEPLRDLFKDEVRAVGEELGLPKNVVWRHPFPGPGLAVRVLGEITPERLRKLRGADRIFLDLLLETGLYDEVWQSFPVLLPVRSVGVMGDGRTYDEAVVLRAVTSVDGMTADWARLPHDFLAECSRRIINEVDGVNRVAYDITSKPPGTIEWE